MWRMANATTARPILSLSEGLERTSVERAIAELRMGRPVLLDSEGEAALVQSVEDLGREEAERLDAMSVRQARLVLPAARLKRLGFERAHNGWVGLPTLDARRVATLAFSMEAQLDGPVRPTGRIEEAALEKSGLELVSHQRAPGRTTAENAAYLAAKRDRAGHLLDQEAAPAG
jgi:GTP cyclohydrolase II